ncbi:hypothetical protein OBBRIDRAFT_612499 [Obba rivulosa]|uniref:Uncharacterized protein n=1 Tax=Obba rivulosa TaxID=1052685 RepID=A0A8E2DSX2_9APHY|nr:hypothetical protein OBBRIDRAFT_612499 [Obba rivulosa]
MSCSQRMIRDGLTHASATISYWSRHSLSWGCSRRKSAILLAEQQPTRTLDHKASLRAVWTYVLTCCKRHKLAAYLFIPQFLNEMTMQYHGHQEEQLDSCWNIGSSQLFPGVLIGLITALTSIETGILPICMSE